VKSEIGSSWFLTIMSVLLADNNPSLPGLSTNNPVKYAQFLQKETTGVVKLWKQRYFILADNVLWYFKDKETAVLGSEELKIDLQRASVRQHGNKGTYYIEFVYTTPASTVETLLLKAPTLGDAQKWVEKVQHSKTAAFTLPTPSSPQSPPLSVAARPAQDASISPPAAPPPSSNTRTQAPSSLASRPPEPAPAPSPSLSSTSEAVLSPADKLKATVGGVFPASYPVSTPRRAAVLEKPLLM
jgi:hypothetical protein